MQVSLIVACSTNRVIGNKGALPWHLPADLQHFKRITTGHCIIMGRKTFESIGKVLPHRTNIVITHQVGYQKPDAVVVQDLNQAFEVAQRQHETEVFVIGGGQLYQQALPFAHKIYYTWVKTMIEGDTFFPAIDLHLWKITQQQIFEADAKNSYNYEFQVWERC